MYADDNETIPLLGPSILEAKKSELKKINMSTIYVLCFLAVYNHSLNKH